MKTLSHTSAPGSDAIDDAVSSGQPGVEVLAAEGREITPACSPWRAFDLLSPERILRAYECYGSTLADGIDWIRFGQLIQSGFYFEHPHGFILIDNVRVGLSAWLHGGTWAKSVMADVAPTRALLDLITQEAKLLSLNARVPQHNILAQRWLERQGFTRCGMIPFDDLWAGVPDGRFIYMRPAGGSGER